MKHMKYFVSTAVGVAVLAFATIASAQSVKQGIATVVRIEGTARYSSSGGPWLTKVNLGAGAGSFIGGTVNIAGLPVTPLHGAGMAAPQQNIVRLQADTELAIDKFTYSQTGADTVTDTELNLKAGKIFGNVKKISAASQFIVKTPTGVYFGADGSCTVVDGSAVISEIINGATVTVTLTEGQSFDPATYNPAVSAQDQVTTLTGDALTTAQNTAQTIVTIVNNSTPTVTATVTTVGDTTIVQISPQAGQTVNTP